MLSQPMIALAAAGAVRVHVGAGLQSAMGHAQMYGKVEDQAPEVCEGASRDTSTCSKSLSHDGHLFWWMLESGVPLVCTYSFVL